LAKLLGEAVALKIAQSRCDGGSEITRLTAHIGPITNTMNLPSGSPHSQHSLALWALAILPGPITRKSNSPLISATNQGTGKPFGEIGRCCIRGGIGIFRIDSFNCMVLILR